MFCMFHDLLWLNQVSRLEFFRIIWCLIFNSIAPQVIGALKNRTKMNDCYAINEQPFTIYGNMILEFTNIFYKP